jgi:hypothetical protein
MARPSPEDRKRIDARQAEHQRMRDEKMARERVVAARVESIVNDAIVAASRRSGDDTGLHRGEQGR